MTRPFVFKLAMLVGAVATAFVLTIYRPSPQGLIPFGVGQAEVRAAPGAAPQKVKGNYDLLSLKVFSQTLVRIRDSYVDPTRVDAKAMLVAALESVQRNVAEVLVDARDDKSELVVTVNDKTQAFNITDVDSPWKLSSRLKEIFRFIQANMNPGSDPAQIEYAAVNGMLSTLDPHSILLDPEGAREMDINTSGKFGGIGIVIGMRKDKKSNENRLTVISLIQGDTPATRAGLKPNDHIVKIGDDPTINLTLNEAMNRLRGDPQTKVTIVVERGETAAQPYELVRDIIHVPSVHPHLLAGNVGYIKLDQFTQGLATETRRAMEDLKKQGAKAWVVDLRGNPGGLLDEAVRVADIFIDSGTLVTTVGYAGKQREEKRAQLANTDHLPLAVLVSPNSASASEIVAGALKNLDRGVIVGQTTFGKGSVQVLFDYEDGSKLKLTIAQYLTPNDVSIQSVGITPDVELDRVFVPEKVASYKDMLRLEKPINRWREADLEAHLTSKNAREGDRPQDVVRYIEEPKAKKKPAAPPSPTGTVDDDDEAAAAAAAEEEDQPADGSERFVEDFQISFARDLVSQATSMHRKELLHERRDFLAKRKVDEEGKIGAALARLGIDWSTGPKAPGAKLVAHVTTDKTGNRVSAGDVIAVTGQVTNSGSAPAYQVHARARNDDWTFEGTELAFGKLDPGQTRAFTAYLKTPKDAETRTDQLEWDFSEAGGARVDAPVTNIAIDGQPRPQFAYTYQLIDETGNGDGLMQPGESFRLHVIVKNVGKGPALMTSALLKNDSGNGIVVNKGRFELKQLPVGESRTMDFTFDVKKDFDDKEATLELSVVDQDLREGVNEKLKFPVAAASAGPAVARGVVRVARKDTEVREGADEGAPVVGVAKKGAVLTQTGKMGGWVRVELEAGRPGFLPAAAVAAGGGATTPGAFVPDWQVTPPTLSLNIPTHETTADRYQLTGTAVDNNHLEDVYVLVSNRDSKIEGKKVFYLSNRGKKGGNKLDFQASVPLWPGNNLITVVARESNEVKAVQNVFVLRNTSPLRTSQAELPQPDKQAKP